MADEILRSKHAFGQLENVDAAISDGKIDAYDILFLKDKDNKPTIGWVDKDGNKVILEDSECKKQVLLVKELPETGDEEVIYIYNSKFYFWNGTEFVSQIDEVGVSEDVVNSKIEVAVSEANAYSDKKLDSALEAYIAEKFEITDVPEGTLVNYYDSEIRIMCPSNSVWVKQAVGEGGDANTYYVTLKTYFTDDNVVGYIEHLNDKSDAEILTDIKTDKYGRRYQPTWLGVAKYDEAADTWTYYGANSNDQKYIGWDYKIDQYNADGIMIASNSVRINLSNEDCHSTTAPFYASALSAEIDAKIAEVASGYEIVEF